MKSARLSAQSSLVDVVYQETGLSGMGHRLIGPVLALLIKALE
jgi:hypothetical protein